MDSLVKINNKKGRFFKKFKNSYKYLLIIIVFILTIQSFTSILDAKLIEKNSFINTVEYAEEFIDEKLILVNRDNALDSDYVPSNLVELNVKFISNNSSNRYLNQEAATQLELMFEDAKKDGIELLAVSGYRPYDYQQKLYENEVKRYGKTQADKYVAQPGTSEHQTGLAIDILSTEYKQLDEGFKNTKAYGWLCENIAQYGYIIRYQENKEDITGYGFEPWHLRYVGVEVATELTNKGITLEEYYK